MLLRGADAIVVSTPAWHTGGPSSVPGKGRRVAFGEKKRGSIHWGLCVLFVLLLYYLAIVLINIISILRNILEIIVSL